MPCQIARTVFEKQECHRHPCVRYAGYQRANGTERNCGNLEAEGPRYEILERIRRAKADRLFVKVYCRTKLRIKCLCEWNSVENENNFKI